MDPQITSVILIKTPRSIKIEAEKSELERRVQECQTKLSEIQSHKDRLESDCQIIQKESDKIKETLEYFAKQKSRDISLMFQTFEENVSKKISSLEENIERLQNRIKKLQNRIVDLQLPTEDQMKDWKLEGHSNKTNNSKSKLSVTKLFGE